MKTSRLLILLTTSLLTLSGCIKTKPVTSSSDTPSQTQSENPSEESSSEESSSEEQSSLPEKLITLFNDKSKLYHSSLTKDVSSLKTYHHYSYGDVPFLDFAEMAVAIEPICEKPRSFTQIDNENYLFSTVDGQGKMYLDSKNDTIKFVNFNRFLDVIGVNNGIYGDLSQNSIPMYQGSNLTQYVKQGHDVNIDLKNYGFDLVSQDNHLYVSIGVVSSVIFPSFVSGICYNGKDYFTDASFRRYEMSVYARSGNYNLSWPLANSECPTALRKVENKLSNETYRFEGVFADRDDRDDLVTMSLFNNGTGTLNGSGTSIIHKAISWKLEDDVIKMVCGQTPYESSDIEDVLADTTDVWINTKETNYAKKTRSDEMSRENYNELCLTYDLSYGLKKDKNITSFDSYFESKNLKERLLSNDIMIYEDAFAELISKHFDDIHSSINGGESVYSASEIKAYLRNKSNDYKGDRNKAYYDEIAELGTLRSKVDNINSYAVEGNTAYLRFQIFTHNAVSTHPINHSDYQTSTHEEAVTAFNNVVAQSPYKAFCIAFNDFGKMNNIKNVVIDVAGNIGGEIRCAPYLTAFMTADPSIVVENEMDDSIIDYHYKVDLNGDEIYGGEGDTFEGKYNFYLLQGANFSAGNEIATMAKNRGFAKIIGRKSAGGACVVGNKTDISGLTYRVSSMYKLMLKSGNEYISNDSGVDVDLDIPFDNMFDLKKMDQWLSTLQ